jgi:GLPGLI family protein
MNKIIVALAFIITGYFNSQAQEFQGTATYESKTSTADFKKRFEGNKDITPEMQKMIEERMKKALEKTLILNFDKQASTYKEEEKLDSPTQQGGGFKILGSMMGGGGTFYKNVKSKLYTVDKDFMGKEFLVKDSLPKINWKLEQESRVIGGYTCYKATAIMPASQSDFRNFRPKKEEENKDKTEDKEKKTNFMDSVELPKDITITAWYTPEIPVNQGPEKYWGLPGLILEVNDGKTIILCSKIVLNPKEKLEIKAPTTGKEITQASYDQIVMDKIKEIQEMNGGNGHGGGFQMRMGRP